MKRKPAGEAWMLTASACAQEAMCPGAQDPLQSPPSLAATHRGGPESCPYTEYRNMTRDPRNFCATSEWGRRLGDILNLKFCNLWTTRIFCCYSFQ